MIRRDLLAPPAKHLGDLRHADTFASRHPREPPRKPFPCGQNQGCGKPADHPKTICYAHHPLACGFRQGLIAFPPVDRRDDYGSWQETGGHGDRWFGSDRYGDERVPEPRYGTGAPMSGPPMSSPPMSGPPMSGPPMSGPPMSGPPIRPPAAPTLRRAVAPPHDPAFRPDARSPVRIGPAAASRSRVSRRPPALSTLRRSAARSRRPTASTAAVSPFSSRCTRSSAASPSC